MTNAAKRIWAFHDGPMVGYFVGMEEIGSNVAEYIRADIHKAVVSERDALRAALKEIAALQIICASDLAVVALKKGTER
jgi:prephenate dehydrogenase